MPNTNTTFESLERDVTKLFRKEQRSKVDAVTVFYNRIKRPNEDIKTYLEKLWTLFREAFGLDGNFSPSTNEKVVKQRFISELTDQMFVILISERNPREIRCKCKKYKSQV